LRHGEILALEVGLCL
jgi:hypothetical protein